MTADVNVTEKVARAVHEAIAAIAGEPIETWDDVPAEDVQEWLGVGSKALSALADPEVLAGIAGVLREHGAVAIRKGNTSRGGLIHNERVCEGCGYELPWHSWRDGLADHAAAAVVEWLRGERA